MAPVGAPRTDAFLADARRDPHLPVRRTPPIERSKTMAQANTAPADHALGECIEACQLCLRACHACAAADVQEPHGGMAQCVLINLDCAAICAAMLEALERRSVHHGDFCALCAHLCRACAAECAKHDHPHCVRCREACERCAEACSRHAGERHAL
jgi:hypothetical protein